MSGFRLSLAGALGLVALLALGLASLRSATVWWTMLASSATLFVLLTGVVGAIERRGADRSFWLGFALFGITYLLLVNWDGFGGQFGYDLTRGLDDWAETVVEPLPRATASASGAGTSSPTLAADRSVKVGNVVQIARMFLSLAFAIGGGLTARATFAGASVPRETRDDSGIKS
ncbi:MAG: hypothetical protein AB7I30_22995 [Isosphaeraceae bacterium]